MSAGIRLAAQGLGGVGEACLLAVEFVSGRAGAGLMTTVYFSPVSGRALVTIPEALLTIPVLAAQAMQPLSSQGEGTGPAAVEAFLSVSASGSLSFGRRSSGSGEVEWSGELPPGFFAPSTAEYCASLKCNIDLLEEPAEISIDWVGSDLPAHVGSLLPGEFEASWSTTKW